MKEVYQLKSTVGFDKWTMQKVNSKLHIRKPINSKLDFSGIAKGYGVDIIAAFLDEKSIKNYMVEIGGEMKVFGKNAKGNDWRLGIDKPVEDGTRSLKAIVNLNKGSLATSGNYRKFRISSEGKKYVHTINPKTGYATESNLLSASVISNKDCADLDAYATAFMAMGLEKTKEFLIKNPSIKVILLFSSKSGIIEEYATYNYN